MTFQRCLLHTTKLQSLKDWLDASGIPHRPGKGEYQALQVWTDDHGWQVIFNRLNKPHLTLNKGLVPLVRRFLNESS